MKNAKDEVVVLSGEPYNIEDVKMKSDFDEYVYQSELSDYMHWYEQYIEPGQQ